MTSVLTKRASLLISLIIVAVLAPTTSALAANDHANDKGKCLSQNTRPWDCIEHAPGMLVAPTAQETAPPVATPEDPAAVQSNIKTAITTGTSLNDEQKEQLRKTLFIFEEFYKSSSAVLAKITQLIEKMAGNIAR